ncbi:MAG: acetylxylan esterase [Armatimonadota bacterium]|nr:acetylxylan esterase [Armatimonadota bacterium]MDR7551005.1 acetylxylan esterase [Armatimonadota bacterium]
MQFIFTVIPTLSDSKANLQLVIGYTTATIWLAQVSLREFSLAAIPAPTPSSEWSPVPLPAAALPDPTALPIRREFPDPLTTLDGRRVVAREEWGQRRQELKTLFQHYMYGYMPPPPSNVRGTVTSVDPSFLDGKATKKELAISFGPPGTPRINVLLIIPNDRGGPAPVFLRLNLRGNDSSYTRSWEFPVEHIVAHGYAVATANYQEVFPDVGDFTGGIFPFFRRPGQTDRAPHDWGAIAMWAWGLQRIVDYLIADGAVDTTRIAVTGHSRLGKAALLAAAFDERIALVIPHQAGTGGSAPSRSKNPQGESVRAIVDRFPYWFNRTFRAFRDDVERLPFDQHSLGPRSHLDR